MARRNRSRTLTKAQAPAPVTYTADQVMALQRASQSPAAGVARPLPRPLEWQSTPFGPGMPLVPSPINPVRTDSGRAEPRAFEFPVTFNLPGFGDRLVPWAVLRAAADQISLFRQCIKIRKDEVATLDWDIVISPKAVERAQRDQPGSSRVEIEKALRQKVDPFIGPLVDFWERPDPRNGHDFIAWASNVLEEYFVLDAIAIYPRLKRNGNLYGFEVLDGSTIKPLLDADGFRPMAPLPAYQQLLYGFPRGEFVADLGEDGAIPGAYPSDRLVYKVHNVRSFTPYGFSAVEQALSDGDLYLRRFAWLKSEYTEGVMPAGWLEAGEGQAEWSPQQLLQYATAFNDIYGGDTAARQRFGILPYGMKAAVGGSDMSERYKPDYDLHLLKLVAAHFDTTIAELGFTESKGLGSEGYHEGQADVQDRKATRPTMRRLEALCTALMRTYLGAPKELEFKILGLESEDEDAADEIANRRFINGRQTLNQDLDARGLPRADFPEADMYLLVTNRGVEPLEGAAQRAAQAGAMAPLVEPPKGAKPGQPGQQPPQGQPQEGEQEQPQGKRPAAEDMAKAELLAYKRWLAKGKTSRPFAFEHLDEVEAVAAGVDLTKAEFAEAPSLGLPKSAALARVGTRPAGRAALGAPISVGFDWFPYGTGEAGR